MSAAAAFLYPEIVREMRDLLAVELPVGGLSLVNAVSSHPISMCCAVLEGLGQPNFVDGYGTPTFHTHTQLTHKHNQLSSSRSNFQSFKVSFFT